VQTLSLPFRLGTWIHGLTGLRARAEIYLASAFSYSEINCSNWRLVKTVRSSDMARSLALQCSRFETVRSGLAKPDAPQWI
jgi:hypothetical protein